jgi:hypothetical protein
MSIFLDEDRFYNLIVWLLSFLLACTVSGVILYVSPSYPTAILLVQIIEIFIFAKIFIYMKRLNNAFRMKNIKPLKLYDIEAREKASTQ